MTFKSRIDAILSEDANDFASSFRFPRLEPWIVKQYNNGYVSPKDYENIIKWVKDKSPNIDGYDFNSALKQAKIYCDGLRNDGFDKYQELQSKSVIQKFDDGKLWLEIGPEDCNSVCHRLQFDCSNELQSVIDGSGKGYALQDPQDNTLCVIVFEDSDYYLIGQFGKKSTKYDKEIKRLCVINGFDLIPEAFGDLELPKAIATGQLDINKCKDIHSVMSRLNDIDIINCNLINYAYYCKIDVVYKLYNKTKHSCLLLYAICYLIVNNLVNTKAYGVVKAAAQNDEYVSSKLRENRRSDNTYFIELLDNAVEQIKNLNT